MRQGARRENILQGYSTDEQRRRSAKDPQPGGVKYFTSVEVFELAKDRAWLARMTNDLNQHWKRKNAVKKQ